eukprot:TRINITY_DN74656_c0_g1_i1.p1 TRINITY_DN74656_c0_g1~~TRINITY_DN74656_c0_g1_i1.p1  ORF type:complete len:373 (-),score=70.77 TRINITY_DN74656_c0_g1_i1:196-1314(-)
MPPKGKKQPALQSHALASSPPKDALNIASLAAAARLKSPLEFARRSLDDGGRQWPVVCAEHTAGHHSTTGSEDRCVCCWLRDGEKDEAMAAVLAVLDGHGGPEAAQLAADRIPELFLTLAAQGRAVNDVLDFIFGELEACLQRSECNSGACANVCVLSGPWLWCANLGDCRSSFVNLETLSVSWLSRDHQASDPAERTRIEEAGGRVEGGRVDSGESTMEPSRTLGDFDFKLALPGVILAQPEQRAIDLRECSEKEGRARGLLIIASDGLWKHISSDCLQEKVAAHRASLRGEQTVQDARDAIERFSQELLALTDDSDDVTIVVAFVDACWDASTCSEMHVEETTQEMWGLEALVDGAEDPLLPNLDSLTIQ